MLVTPPAGGHVRTPVLSVAQSGFLRAAFAAYSYASGEPQRAIVATFE